MALFYECMLKCDRKLLDTADIVRDAILRPRRLSPLSKSFILTIVPGRYTLPAADLGSIFLTNRPRPSKALVSEPPLPVDFATTRAQRHVTARLPLRPGEL